MVTDLWQQRKKTVTCSRVPRGTVAREALSHAGLTYLREAADDRVEGNLSPRAQDKADSDTPTVSNISKSTLVPTHRQHREIWGELKYSLNRYTNITLHRHKQRQTTYRRTALVYASNTYTSRLTYPVMCPLLQGLFPVLPLSRTQQCAHLPAVQCVWHKNKTHFKAHTLQSVRVLILFYIWLQVVPNQH